MDIILYQEAVQYLLQIPKFTKKNKKGHTAVFLDRIGHYRNQKNIIHVAGTNGKGSVCSYISAILVTAGFRVGMFTSPHLIKVNERFCINGKPVADEIFLEAFIKVKKVIDQMLEESYPHPTFFECMVAMASVIFSDAGVDYLIMETGLGGRLDATNIVERPLASVITSIGHDHMEYLGNTLEEIASEKAGIIKYQVPVIYDAGQEEVNHVIEKKANELCAPCYSVEEKNCKNFKITNKHIDFSFFYEYDKNILLHLETIALYQVINAAIAVKTIFVIDTERRITVDHIQQGIAETVWNGRMEWISPGILLDGAHNPDGMRQAAASVRQLLPEKKILLLFSAVKDKNYEQMIEWLCSEIPFQSVIVTELSVPRAAKGEELRHIFMNKYKGPVYLEKDIIRAADKAMTCRTKDTVLFCAGSLYLIGELRDYFLKRKDDR